MPTKSYNTQDNENSRFHKLMISPLAAVVYADLFGYPLTVKEAKLWAIRKTREKYSQEKFNQATEIIPLLKLIPTIEAVFLTGSVAANNAKKNADIDLMIITSSNTAWLTRAVVFIILKIIKKFKNPVCPNIFLDLNHLEIKNKNLYTAHEVLQAKCLYDKSNINYLWLEKNKWTKDYLPNAYQNQKSKVKNQNLKLKVKRFLFLNWIFAFCLLNFEFLSFILQYLFMKRKITNEKMGWGYAFFHPRDLSEKIVAKFEKKFKQLSSRRRADLHTYNTIVV